MAFFHHGTIRKYTAAIINLFNSIEVQYKLTNDEVHTKIIPIKYSSKEKYKELDNKTTEQILSGNTNVLPRSNLSLISMSKSTERSTNKNLKIGRYKNNEVMEYMYNSVAYDFEFELVFQCRGMNEATQIIEQIAPKFNNTVNVDIWDAQNLDEPSRIPLVLNDIAFDQEEYSEISSNLVTLTFSLTLSGNLYPPIKTFDRIKEFDLYINEVESENTATRVFMKEWDVGEDGKII